jgi:hypothetical protein
MRKHKIILAVFILLLASCKTFTEVATKGRYKKIWVGRQLNTHSCIRRIHETIKDTVENYTVQQTWEKRQICGFYGWPIKLCTITYNKQNKKSIILAALFLSFGFANAQTQSSDNITSSTDLAYSEPTLTFSDLSVDEKAEAVKALINGDCEYKGIKLYGKVQFVTSFPDIKIQYVTSFPDIKVKFVTSFPDKCGLWQETTSFPAFKVQIVESFPDLKVQKVDSFPGMK